MQETRVFDDFSHHTRYGYFDKTAENFCQLIKEGQPLKNVLATTLKTVAPILHVPSHRRIINGEFSLVNYDHATLAMRGGVQLMRYLPDEWKYLPMTQAMWYTPQGLDVWAQRQGKFPGHYAGKTPNDFAAIPEPTVWYPEQAPFTKGDFDARLEDYFTSIIEGESIKAYALFLGLAEEKDPEKRKRLLDQTLYAVIIDIEETIVRRQTRNTGHKTFRVRAMIELTKYLGWENAHDAFYACIPDLPTDPRWYGWYEEVSSIVKAKFKDNLPHIKEKNTIPCSEEDIDKTIEVILKGSPEDVKNHITSLLENGRSVVSIADAITVACARFMMRLSSPKQFFIPGHVFDYMDAANYWIRHYDNPHQTKALYLEAMFINDAVTFDAMFKNDPLETLPDVDPNRDGGVILEELYQAIADQKPALAMGLTDAYLKTHDDASDLMRTMALASGRFQNDPHIARMTMTGTEEYENNTTSRKNDMLMALANYLAGYGKRTMALDCHELYKRYFVN